MGTSQPGLGASLIASFLAIFRLRTYVLRRNLGTFYFSGVAPWDWTTPSNGNLWQDGSKTLFDPCPAGWRVPKGGAENLSPWCNFSKTGQNQGPPNTAPGSYPTDPNGGHAYFRYGTSGDTSWHPAAGFRYMNSSIMATGNDGRYWSTTYQNTVAYFLGFNKSGVFPSDTNTGRSGGYPVRCLRE